MSQQKSQHRFLNLSTLIGIVALSGIAGCGEGMLEPTASSAYGLTSAAIGTTTSGTYEGPGNNPSNVTVTKIVAYATSSYIYGIKLYWGNNSKLYGETHNLDPQILKLNGDLVYKIEYAVADNKLRAIQFSNVAGNLYAGLSALLTTAFDDPDAVFTDLETWKGVQAGDTVIWGAKFHYKIQ